MTVENILEIVYTDEESKNKKSVDKLKEVSNLNDNYSDLNMKSMFFEVDKLTGLSRSDYINVGENGFSKEVNSSTQGIVLGESDSEHIIIHLVDDTILEIEKDTAEDKLEFLSLAPESWIKNIKEKFPKVKRKLTN